jgi:threonylcarbamoyladenosine tRNA methylthiotransferase MtaB
MSFEGDFFDRGCIVGAVKKDTISPHRSISLFSIGCRTNQQEMAALKEEFRAQGHHIVDDIRDAQVVVINTCSVTAHTESKTRRLIRSVARNAPHAEICCTGCLAQQQPKTMNRFRGVRWVVGNGRKHEIASIIGSGTKGVFHSPVHACATLDSDMRHTGDARGSGRTRFLLKIQEGCDKACAYCIVPSLRGRSRSAPRTQVIDTCRRALDAGYKEIVLTGTHIGQYRDSDERFVDIVARILALSSYDFRVRLSSLNPGDITDELCGLVDTNTKVCRHIHVSFQSLCPDIVRSMNRSVEEMESCIQRLGNLQRKNPDIALGADLMVGFPGETAAMFEQALCRAKDLGLAYGHVFRYSRRPHTPAARFACQVEEKQKTARSERLRTLLSECRCRFIESQLGRIHRLLVESQNPCRGLTSNYIRAEAPNAKAAHNTWLNVALAGFNKHSNCCSAESVSGYEKAEKTDCMEGG